MEASRELIPSCPTFLLGEEAEALEGAGMRSFRELRQDRWGKLGRAGQASAVSSCYRCVSLLCSQPGLHRKTLVSKSIFPGDRVWGQLTQES